MTLDDLELLAREGLAGALAMAEADPTNADQLRSVATRFEVAGERCRSAREFMAEREKKNGRAALRGASSEPKESRAQRGPTKPS